MKISQTSKGIQLNTALRTYMVEHCVREHPVLKELREKTAAMPEHHMQIFPEQGQFMAMLLKILNPKHILEIGTYTGYSALCMALAVPDAHITALDKNPEWTKIAKKYWQKAGVENRIELILGDAQITLPSLPKNYFDCIFIDANKKNYLFYVQQGLQHLTEKGILLIDNTLWYGRVVDSAYQDFATIAIRDLNEVIAKNETLDISIIPIGDGLTIVRKK